MNYKYVLTQTIYYNAEHTRTSYGIAVISAEENVSVLFSIEDITNEQSELTKLVELCNAQKLEIEHLQSVVEDFLYYKSECEGSSLSHSDTKDTNFFSQAYIGIP